MSDYMEHHLLKENKMESRPYQESIAATGYENNLMCVLPTGLGKTPIAILLSAMRLDNTPDSKIMVMAPTKPLVEQHKNSFAEFIDLPEEEFKLVTGKTAPEKREDVWSSGYKYTFVTPHCVENDIEEGRLKLNDYSLLVFDECHHAAGDYPYVSIARSYEEQADKSRILGLTASPGGEKEKIEEVAENLYIDKYEIRTEDDPEVKPYIKEKETEWVKVSLTKHFKRVKRHLDQTFDQKLKELKGLGFIDKTSQVSKTDLLDIREKIDRELSEKDDPRLYRGISKVAECLKLQHALEMLEAQGLSPFWDFVQKLKKDDSKASTVLLNNKQFKDAISVAEWMKNKGMEHPKLEKTEEILKDEFSQEDKIKDLNQFKTGSEVKKEKKDGKTAIIFTQYRDTVDLIYNKLDQNELSSKLRPVKFKGQKEDFTQERQKQILNKFRSGAHNVLVSTSVGEEGLDIPGVDLVLFYEPIPSGIRSIQRRGRTGRQKPGKIYILMAEGTRDESYYWSSYHKERRMKGMLKGLSQDDESEQEKETEDKKHEEEKRQETLDGWKKK